jgi:phage I-like protein
MAILKSFNVEINNNALKHRNLPTKLKVLGWGKNITNDGDVYLTKETVRVFEANQIRAGRDKAVPIDFDHTSVKGSKEYVPGQPKVFAGYGDPVIVEGDGLYLYNIEWTDAGEKFARNYKDLSPAAVLDRQGVMLGLDSVALTPTGAVRDLNFFSAGGFDENMIKNMSNGTMNDNGASNAKPTSTGFVVKDASTNAQYNVKGANPAVRMTPGGPVINPMVSDMGGSGGGSNMSMLDTEDENALDNINDLKDHEETEIENDKHDPNNPNCECASCKSADNNLKISSAVGTVKDTKKKTMSANNPSFPDAYRAQPLQYDTMNDTIIKKMSSDEVIKKMAAEVGMPVADNATSDSSLVARVLFAFLAKYEGIKAEIAGQITNKANTDEGGMKQFSADMDAMKAEIKALKTQKVEDTTIHDNIEREQLIRQAAREGKLVPLSADQVKVIDIGLLKSIITNQPKNVVPMGSALRVLSVQSDNKPSREKAVAAFDAMVIK